MSDSRQGVLAHHINHALHRGTTMRRYAGDVATHYLNTVPLHARQLPLQITRDPIADERHNAQVVQRWLDGAVRMPVEAEESLVLSLPEPFRAECQRELAERLGLLAAPLPSKDGARATVTTADLLRETGELMLALSPLFADGKVDAGDLPNARRAIRECDDVLGRLTTLRAELTTLLLADSAQSNVKALRGAA